MGDGQVGAWALAQAFLEEEGLCGWWHGVPRGLRWKQTTVWLGALCGCILKVR